jgi:hypothetical protein
MLESLVPFTNRFFASFLSHLKFYLLVGYKTIVVGLLLLYEGIGMDGDELSYSHAI